MALEQIPNQPIILNPEEDCPDCDPRCFCQTYAGDDNLYWQGEQVECTDDIICDSDFSDVVITYVETLPDNLTLNGDFATDSSDWVLAGNWVWDSGHLEHTPSSNGACYQDISFLSGHQRLIKFTVANYVAGSIRIMLQGGGQPNQYLTVRSSNGTFSELVIANADKTRIYLLQSVGFNGEVDDVEMYEYEIGMSSDCWTVDTPANISLSGDGLCHIPGVETIIEQVNAVVVGGYYKVLIKITNYAAGKVTVKLGTAVSEDLQGDSIFTQWITSDGTDLTIIMSTDFEGCVEWVQLYKLNNSYAASIIDSETGAFVMDITGSISYYKDWITIVANFVEKGIAIGCYKLALFGDCCTDCVPAGECGDLCNIDFSVDESDLDNVCWTQFTSGNVTSKIQTFIGEHWDVFFGDTDPAFAYIKQPITLCKNRTYDFGFTYITAIDFDWEIEFFNANQELLVAISRSGSVTDETGTIAVSMSTCSPGQVSEAQWVEPFLVRLKILKGPGEPSGNVAIDNFTFSIVALDVQEDCPDFTSNCFCYAADNDCKEKIMMGYADTPAYGFEFINTGFRLQVRTVFALDKPSYNSEETNYVYSDGTRELSFSSNEKHMIIFIEQVDSVTHDSISVIRLLKHFYLGDKNNVLTEYIAKKGDYQPEWVKDEYLKLAPSRFDVSKKGSIGFMSNC